MNYVWYIAIYEILNASYICLIFCCLLIAYLFCSHFVCPQSLCSRCFMYDVGCKILHSSLGKKSFTQMPSYSINVNQFINTRQVAFHP